MIVEVERQSGADNVAISATERERERGGRDDQAAQI